MERQQGGFQGAKYKMESPDKQSACVGRARSHHFACQKNKGQPQIFSRTHLRWPTSKDPFGFLYSFLNNVKHHARVSLCFTLNINQHSISECGLVCEALL
jgi:hypothetical protein